jgi:hypothetical protein
MLVGFHKFVLSIVRARAHASHDAAAANLVYEYTKFSICVDLVPVYVPCIQLYVYSSTKFRNFRRNPRRACDAFQQVCDA